MKNFKEEAIAISEEVIEWRRYLHTVPELGLDLPVTSAFIEEKLKSFGVEPRRIGSSGITGTIGKGEKLFFLRADSDALPIIEETNLPFASKNENMHACGHDMHTASLLGAIKLLKEHENELSGRIQFLFQPAEEVMNGALQMIKNGVFDQAMPNAGSSLHVFPTDLFTINSRPGYLCASTDGFTITVNGVGCHGAYAYLGVDPVNIAAHIVIALQEIQTREVSSNDNMILTICAINGGKAVNAFPNQVQLRGTFRTARNEIRSFVRKRMIEICNGVCATFRGSCDIEFHGPGCPPLVNDEKLYEEVLPFVKATCGEENYRVIDPIPASEDFSEYAACFPIVDYWVGTGGEKEGCNVALHHPQIIFSEEALPNMIALFANIAFNWLEKNK